jgi:hypothetical protein
MKLSVYAKKGSEQTKRAEAPGEPAEACVLFSARTRSSLT